jgi:S-formylglutathione hydrolase
MSEITQKSSAHCFGGDQRVYSHTSSALNCDMNFAAYLPPQAENGSCPVLYWLSGLTCTEENFINKAGAQQFAAKHGIIVIAPDTSPRGDDVPDDDNYDLGKGAGFYLNATQEPWSKHFHMYDYIVTELPALVEANLPVANRRGIFGHSMGGHGALTISLKNPGRYQSVSAFSPIIAPTQVPWGHKAFTAYLGDDRSTWEQYDATCLLSQAGERLPILIDQGLADGFLEEQLKSDIFETACRDVGHPLELRMQPGYDHSYYFISSFMGDHFAHHAKALSVA